MNKDDEKEKKDQKMKSKRNLWLCTQSVRKGHLFYKPGNAKWERLYLFVNSVKFTELIQPEEKIALEKRCKALKVAYFLHLKKYNKHYSILKII